MFRHIILFFTLFSVAMATIAPAANGGCSSRRYSPRSRIVRYSQPVVRYATVRPVVRDHQPIVHPPKVVAAPRPSKRLPTVPAGSTITLPANFLGNQLGDAFMVFNKIKLPIKVERWTPTE